MAEIYLDSNLRPCGTAIDWMRAALERKDAPPVERCTQMIYDLVGASKKDTFSFVSSGAEAIAQVHWTVFTEVARKEGKCHFITTATPNMELFHRLEELGCFVKIAPLDSSGKIDLEKLAELITPRTAMISIAVADGRTGVVQPVEEIAQMAKEKGVLLHGDASFALGKMAQPFEHLDYLTLAGDKIHSVKSSGAVFAKEGRPLVPYIPGADVDTASLIALGAAASQASLAIDTMSLEVARLRDHLESSLDVKPLYTDSLRLPNVTVLTFPRVHHEMLHYTLKRKNLFADCIDGALSFSLTRYTTQDDIDQAIAIINDATKTLKLLTEDLF